MQLMRQVAGTVQAVRQRQQQQRSRQRNRAAAACAAAAVLGLRCRRPHPRRRRQRQVVRPPRARRISAARLRSGARSDSTRRDAAPPRAAAAAAAGVDLDDDVDDDRSERVSSTSARVLERLSELMSASSCVRLATAVSNCHLHRLGRRGTAGAGAAAAAGGGGGGAAPAPAPAPPPPATSPRPSPGAAAAASLSASSWSAPAAAAAARAGRRMASAWSKTADEQCLAMKPNARRDEIHTQPRGRPCSSRSFSSTMVRISASDTVKKRSASSPAKPLNAFWAPRLTSPPSASSAAKSANSSGPHTKGSRWSPCT